jgi:hypothetical protein
LKFAGEKPPFVAAFNPGLMLDTNFISNSVHPIIGGIAYCITPLIRWSPFGHLLRSSDISGEHLAKLVLGELGQGTESGCYFDGLSLKPASEFARSVEGTTIHQKALWKHSLNWCGLSSSN